MAVNNNPPPKPPQKTPSFKTPTATTTVTPTTNTIEQSLSLPISLTELIRKSAAEASTFKSEATHLSSLATDISTLLRVAARATKSNSLTYDRPITRIVSSLTQSLEKSLSLLRRHRRRRRNLLPILRRLFTLVSTSADFKKSISLLDNSLADLHWLLSLSSAGGATFSLPPISANDPILSYVWSLISVLYNSSDDVARVDAVKGLTSLAEDSDRNKVMIVEEGGVGVLLRLLKSSEVREVQVVAAEAVKVLCFDGERVRSVVEGQNGNSNSVNSLGGVQVIVEVLSDSCMIVQSKVLELVTRMVELDEVVKEDFGKENGVRCLVSILSFEVFDDLVLGGSGGVGGGGGFRLVVEREKERKRGKGGGLVKATSMGGRTRKEREREGEEVKREVKVNCGRALWMMVKGSVENSKRLTETKGLLCLARLIEKESGELRRTCLMAVMEIAACAEVNADLRRSAFKTNSPAAKAVVEQLLRVVKESSGSGGGGSESSLVVAAVKSIGCLSRTFPAKETRVISVLVEQLDNLNHEVATEAAIALGKFTCEQNFLRQEHSKAIIEFNGVLPVMRLIRASERGQVHGLILLCNLAINASENKELEQARVMTALEGADRSFCSLHPMLKVLLPKAIEQLSIYRGVGGHLHQQPSMRR